ncbi:MAG: DinB family protein [Bacteroidetes bacterium]|nr:DinB family protein [Bacteroidota bacterium]
MENQQKVFVHMAMNAWNSHVKRADGLFSTLTDAQLMEEVAPGKNRGVYLVGHLAAVHDRMFSLLGIGERQYERMDDAFISNPDKKGIELMPVTEVRKAWESTNQKLADAFTKMQPEEWFMKHTQMTDEDLAKEPHRNRLSVLISRTDHLAYHLGQVALIKK